MKALNPKARERKNNYSGDFMVWYNPFTWGQTKNKALSQEERISKGKALESARNYIEAAIRILEELVSKKDKLSDRDILQLKGQVQRHYSSAIGEVSKVDEQIIHRTIDDCSNDVGFRGGILKHKGGTIDMAVSTYEELLKSAQGILDIINRRLSEL